MQLNPVQLSKTNSNTHLLNLLTKRSAKTLTNINNNWPGKFSPSLANIIIKRSNNSKSVTAEFKPKNKSMSTLTRNRTQKMIKTVPLIKMSSATLSLIPSARSKTITMHNTWRSTKNKFFTNDYLAKANNQLEFKNSRVCQVINNQNLEEYKRRSIIQIMSNIQDEISEKQKIGNQDSKNTLNGYVIDYKTFNYIDKVIDNPEKWQKFVHKKNQDEENQFITSTYQPKHTKPRQK